MPTQKELLAKTHEEFIDKAKKRLLGVNPRAAGTITSYTQTWRRFLTYINRATFTSEDVDRYFNHRRTKDGISARTIRKEFSQIKTLALIHQIPWPFQRWDIPKPKEKAKQTIVSPEDIETLIRSYKKLSFAERFYLAVSTIYACRREALAELNVRLVGEDTITIPGVHEGETITHVIPPVLKPIFQRYHVKEHSTTALSLMFRSICKKAGVQLEKGTGWHSLRRMTTKVVTSVMRSKNISEAYWAQYTGWSTSQEGETFMGSSMAAYYARAGEISSTYLKKIDVLTSADHDNDPYWLDHSIFLIHPFLKAWDEAIKAAAQVKPASKNTPPRR